jgi:hypothetical protein
MEGGTVWHNFESGTSQPSLVEFGSVVSDEIQMWKFMTYDVR